MYVSLWGNDVDFKLSECRDDLCSARRRSHQQRSECPKTVHRCESLLGRRFLRYVELLMAKEWGFWGFQLRRLACFWGELSFNSATQRRTNMPTSAHVGKHQYQQGCCPCAPTHTLGGPFRKASRNLGVKLRCALWAECEASSSSRPSVPSELCLVWITNLA